MTHADPAERFEARIWDLREQANEDLAEFTPPRNPPKEERAMSYLTAGAGPAVSVYVEARTSGLMVHFPPDQYEALESTMNDYLELYAACYGRDIDAEYTVRTAAEALIDTRDIGDVARILTHVPAE